MSFKNWLLLYRGEAAIMNLASDAERNPPHGLWGPDELRQHMRNSGASDDVMALLEDAIDMWRRDRQRVAETTKTL